MQFKMPTCVMKLYKIRIITTPNICSDGGFIPSYKVFCKYTQFYDSFKYQKMVQIKGKPHSDFIPGFDKNGVDGSQDGEHKEFDAENQVLVYDDVKIEFY